jgi:hypothetical protein
VLVKIGVCVGHTAVCVGVCVPRGQESKLNEMMNSPGHSAHPSNAGAGGPPRGQGHGQGQGNQQHHAQQQQQQQQQRTAASASTSPAARPGSAQDEDAHDSHHQEQFNRLSVEEFFKSLDESFRGVEQELNQPYKWQAKDFLVQNQFELPIPVLEGSILTYCKYLSSLHY